jgi:DNA (cytosine-5)-methyltransferase 1
VNAPMPKQLLLDVHDKLIVDLFAGGGGMSVAFEIEFGRSPDIAINHNEEALSLHRANHPLTEHFIADVFEVDPHDATQGRPVGWLHLSPDCTHHSQASGGQPRSKKIRGLSWVGYRWAGQVKPDRLSLENVKQILKWGPLIAKRDKATGRVVTLDIIECPITHKKINRVAEPGEQVPVSNQYLVPDTKREGKTWRRFVSSLRALGYVVEWKILCAADFGGHTTRERLFMIATLDHSQPIIWPEPTHFKNPKKGQKKWKAAAECIDFSDLGNSIFGRKKELADSTKRRIAKGMKRYVIDAANPFVINMAHGGKVEPISEPMSTIATEKGGCRALATPVIVQTSNTNANGHCTGSVEDPMKTSTSRQEFALASPIITVYRGESAGRDIEDPLPTITSGGDSERDAGAAHALGLTSPVLVQATHQGSDRVYPLEDPIPTITAANRGETMLAAPVMIQAAHGEGKQDGTKRWGHGSKDVKDPVGAITGSGGHAVASSILVGAGGPEYSGKPTSAEDPMGTVMTENHKGVATAYMMQANDGFNTNPGRGMDEPISTITNKGSQQQLVAANLAQLRKNCDGRDLEDPLMTVSAEGQHHGLVSAFMSSYYTDESDRCRSADDPLATITTENRIGVVECMLSPEDEASALRVAGFLMEYYSEGGQWSELDKPLNTITTRDRLALVTVVIKGTPYVIVDIRLRMLKPRELFRGQDFPDSYIIDRGHDGRKFSVSSQVRMCGNSVDPKMATAFLGANAPWLSVRKAA